MAGNMARCARASAVFLLSFLVSWTLVAPKKFGGVNKIPSAEFDAFVESPSTLSAVYFYRRELPQVKNFVAAFEAAAKFMKLYQVQFGRVNCDLDPVAAFCDQPAVDQKVFAIRHGRVEAEFQLDTMYNSDAISSNIFQVLLSSEVPVLQSGSDLKHEQARNAGKKDVMFSYLKAIGTYEHRVFMEFAFAYGSTYKFAFATDKRVAEEAGLRDAKAMTGPTLWVLHCSEEEKGSKTCHQTRFRQPIVLSDVLIFVKSLKLPSFVDLPVNQEPTPYETLGLHLIYVVTDNSNAHEARDMAGKLGRAFRGVAGVIYVNIDTVSESTLDTLTADTERLREVPTAAIQLNGQDELTFMHSFTEGPLVENLEGYISIHTEGKKKKHKKQSEEDEYDEVSDTDTTSPSDENSWFEGWNSDTASSSDDENPWLEEEEVQDDVVAEAVYRNRFAQLDFTYAPALTDKTFPATLKEKSLLVVVFYLSWDARSAAFLASCSEASLALKDDTTNSSPLARVACDDWPDVCQLNNVTSYPTTKAYRDGKFLKDYRGMLETTALVNFIRLLQLPAPVELQTMEDVTSFREGLMSTGGTNTAVLGLMGADSQGEVGTFTSVAQELQGNFLLGLVKDKELAEEVCSSYDCTVPAVVLVKRDDPYQPFKLFTGKLAHKPSLVNFVRLASLPVFPELTPQNFPSLFSRDQPFVVLFGGRGAELDNVGQIAATGELPVIFCQMNVFSPDSLGAELLQFYVPNAGLPALVMVKHKTGGVFEYPYPDDLSKEKVSDWIRGCESGDIKANNELQEEKWAPMMPGYDFLAFIDAEKEQAKERQDQNVEVVTHPEDGNEPDEEEEEEIHPDSNRLGHPEVKVHKHSEL